ncbi:hypothetical protein [Amycolatopsis sp. NPDC059657]|uniref:hypothetical protein n=1 Tax=Amycolatopsis sp. NPDC059657 TaxID=3346899 RepID=UPI00366F047A
MEPYELHRAHVDGLVNAALQFGLIKPCDDLTAISRMLYAEHVAARTVRDGGDDPPGRHVELAGQPFHPAAVLCLIDCYERRSSRALTWHTGTAAAWTRQLRATVLAQLPAKAATMIPHGSRAVPAYQVLPAYVGTPWGITSVDQVCGYGASVQTSTQPKGLRAQVLIGPYHSPRGGLSARTRHVVVLGVGPDRDLPAFARVAEPSDDMPGVFLLFEYGRHVARPADTPPGRWLMASGAFVHSTDSRWRDLVGHSLPIPLHDRSES